MNYFDFSSEMVYGKKHLCKLDYDTKKYKFVELVTELFGCELNKLHTIKEREYEVFTEIGKDSNTEFHQTFYKKLHEGWCIQEEYDKFVKEIILPFLGLKEAMIQKFPTFRVMLTDNVVIVTKHHDSDELHKHPTGEINFIMGLTDIYDSNTLHIEKMPRLEEYEDIILKAGETICFNGNKCDHYNEINKTGYTRVSVDFRILPLNYYDDNNKDSSASTNTKYVEGGYYKKLKVENQGYIARDIWDKEKELFNSVMNKYNVKDAWGVVDLFEKKIANYAGSKYAVSVDSCTDALFLCLKYLKAKGEVILPSKTWISVPCTVIHAGCKVKFEDYEWSGMYQLKPYPVYDGAVRMKKNMFQPNTFHCLSFHIRKHIPIGKGGMILTDDKNAYDWFRTVRYEGRTMSEDGINYMLYKDDPINSQGWNMYMTPEQAARGIELFDLKINDNNPDQESSGTYKNLEKLGIYDIDYLNKKQNIEIINSLFLKYKDKRLYLGCNDKYIKGFINIDILKDTKADIISDVTQLPEFDNNTIDLIYSSHMIEHVSRHKYKSVLKRWFDLLKDDGILRLALPDLEALSKYYIEQGDINDVRGCMFGGQKNNYDYHYFGHDFKSLKTDLEEIGFIDVKRYDWRELDYEIKDWSRDYLPKHYDNGNMIPDEEWYKGSLVSLNIECKKKCKDDNYYYSLDYWFNNKEHDDWNQGYEKYYVNTFYENIVMKLEDIPKEGKILILGTHNCVAFDKLCRHFGYDRCIGYDLHNPTNHPNVIIRNCMELCNDDKLDIAFCHNDLGNYKTTPILKEHGQKWAAKNIISGGYMLSNNDYNRAKIKNIEIMENNGFEVAQLVNLEEKYNLYNLEFERKEGYMLSKKK